MVTGNCVKSFDDVINYYVTGYYLARILEEVKAGKIENHESALKSVEHGVKFLEHAREGSSYNRVNRKSHPYTISANSLKKLGKITSQNLKEEDNQISNFIHGYSVKLSLVKKILRDDHPEVLTEKVLSELKEFFETVAILEAERCPPRHGCFW